LFLRVHARGCQSAMVDLSQLQNHLLIRLFGFFAPDASPSAAKSPRLSSRPTPRHLPAGRNLHGLSRLRPGSGYLWKTEISCFQVLTFQTTPSIFAKLFGCHSAGQGGCSSLTIDTMCQNPFETIRPYSSPNG
jgi:hypothetical protein